MREIKFRAIHKLTKKVWNEEELIFHNGKWYEDWRAFEDGMSLNMSQCEVMQYTGLKDKNGVEIYEGDIVKRTHLFNGGYGETHTGEVVYDMEYARYVISKPQTYTEPKTEDIRNTLSDKSTYEVIGNIYENPELLEREGE